MTWLDQLLAERMGPGIPVGGPPPEDPFDVALEDLCAGLPEEEALALREERAGVLEFLAGFSRAEAERRAGLRMVGQDRRQTGVRPVPKQQNMNHHTRE